MTDEVTSGEILRRFDRFEQTVLDGFASIKNDYVRRDVWQEARAADMREVGRLASEAKDVAESAAANSRSWRDNLVYPLVVALVAACVGAGLTLLLVHGG